MCFGIGAATAVTSGTTTSAETDAMTLWREERKLVQDPSPVRLGVAPVKGGAAALSLSGSF